MPSLGIPLLGLISKQQSHSTLLGDEFLFQFLLLLMKIQMSFSPKVPEVWLLLCFRHLGPFSNHLSPLFTVVELCNSLGHMSLASIVSSVSIRRLFLDFRIHFNPFWK